MKSERCLVLSDADLPIYASVAAWINDSSELVVEYCYEDDEEPSQNFTRWAVVDSEDSVAMARHRNVRVEKLPEKLRNHFGLDYEALPSDAERIFQECLNWILDSGVRYRFQNPSF